MNRVRMPQPARLRAFRLRAFDGGKSHPDWSVSGAERECLVYAKDEKWARQLASDQFSPAVASCRGSPWANRELVECKEGSFLGAPVSRVENVFRLEGATWRVTRGR